jgi:hypothetical protein
VSSPNQKYAARHIALKLKSQRMKEVPLTNKTEQNFYKPESQPEKCMSLNRIDLISQSSVGKYEEVKGPKTFRSNEKCYTELRNSLPNKFQCDMPRSNYGPQVFTKYLSKQQELSSDLKDLRKNSRYRTKNNRNLVSST